MAKQPSQPQQPQQPGGAQPTQAIDWNHLLQQLQSLTSFAPEVYALVSRIVASLKQPPQALASQGAQECEPDQCACDCLKEQQEHLVQALATTVHLQCRFKEE